MTPLVDEIKGKLNAARSVGEVNAVARAYGAAVADMDNDPVLYTMAIHIRNLARYKRFLFTGEWK